MHLDTQPTAVKTWQAWHAVRPLRHTQRAVRHGARRPTEHALGPAVYRRGVEQARAGVPHGADDFAAALSGCARTPTSATCRAQRPGRSHRVRPKRRRSRPGHHRPALAHSVPRRNNPLDAAGTGRSGCVGAWYRRAGAAGELDGARSAPPLAVRDVLQASWRPRREPRPAAVQGAEPGHPRRLCGAGLGEGPLLRDALVPRRRGDLSAQL